LEKTAIWWFLVRYNFFATTIGTLFAVRDWDGNEDRKQVEERMRDETLR
jgi:hypothetical protein